MQVVRQELKRLARGIARRTGHGRAARWHVLLLVAAVVAAFISRAWRPLPFLSELQGHVLPTLLTALALYALGWVLGSLWTWFLQERDTELARDLDARYGWHDETSTALALQPPEGDRALAALLVAQTQGRLRELKPSTLAAALSPWELPRRLLAFLFAFVLLAPGVDGLLGKLGAGNQGTEALGVEGAEEDTPAPRPMRADFWLQTFVENPLGVEPLPSDEPAAEPGQPAAGDPMAGDPKAGDAESGTAQPGGSK